MCLQSVIIAQRGFIVPVHLISSSILRPYKEGAKESDSEEKTDSGDNNVCHFNI